MQPHFAGMRVCLKLNNWKLKHFRHDDDSETIGNAAKPENF
jgi:hypothetical protein